MGVSAALRACRLDCEPHGSRGDVARLRHEGLCHVGALLGRFGAPAPMRQYSHAFATADEGREGGRGRMGVEPSRETDRRNTASSASNPPAMTSEAPRATSIGVSSTLTLGRLTMIFARCTNSSVRVLSARSAGVGRDSGEQRGARIPAEAVAQQEGELRITEVHVALPARGALDERADHDPES